MPHSESALQTAENLLVLTYALGEAAKSADNAELGALFAERAKLLAVLESAEPSPEVLEVLRKVQAAEVQAQGEFHKAKASAVRDMEKGLHGKKVHGTYARRGNAQSLDFSG